MTIFYHGGVPFLKVGSEILPPSLTNAPAKFEKDATSKNKAVNDTIAAHRETYRNDRVFITPDLDIAISFAIAHRSGVGQCYEVVPLGEIEADPYLSTLVGCAEAGTLQCFSARIVRIVPISNPMRQELLRLYRQEIEAAGIGDGMMAEVLRVEQRETRERMQHETHEIDQRKRDRRKFEKNQRKIAQRARKRGG